MIGGGRGAAKDPDRYGEGTKSVCPFCKANLAHGPAMLREEGGRIMVLITTYKGVERQAEHAGGVLPVYLGC